MSSQADHFVLICSTCQGEIEAKAAKASLDATLPPGFATRMIACMAGCERPMTVGLQAEGKAQYLFGDIQSPADLDAIAAFARQFRDSDDGWTSATDRPPALLFKTLARLPRLSTEGEK